MRFLLTCARLRPAHLVKEYLVQWLKGQSRHGCGAFTTFFYHFTPWYLIVMQRKKFVIGSDTARKSRVREGAGGV